MECIKGSFGTQLSTTYQKYEYNDGYIKHFE